MGLAHVQPHTGERVANVDEEGEGSCFEFKPGDVLYGRLRPYLNKVYYAEHGGVCSTEFHVIRVHRASDGKPTVQPDFLAAVLRSRIVLAQTRHMMTGNTHPRLTNEDVVDLYIPIPDAPIQSAIVREAKRRREEARRLREAAAQLWEKAKHRFEQELLGPVAVAVRGHR